MKQYVALAAMMLTAASGMAQETYENARLMEDELNGTARYVAMGGAMDALGADISTISTNPAGIGLFRHSNLSTSFGLVSQEDGQNAGWSSCERRNHRYPSLRRRSQGPSEKNMR